MNLKDKTILVTGANGGLGRALVQTLLEKGAGKIYAAARLPDALPDKLQSHPRVIAIKLDITDVVSVAAAAGKCTDVDLLINNAGVNCCMGLLNPNAFEAARKEMDVNYFGTLSMCRVFARTMIARGTGTIANVCSIIGLVNLPANGTYCASKAAGHSLLQGIRAELAPRGISVVGIYPGPVDTRMTASQKIPKTAPEEVADAIVVGLANGDEEIFPDAMSQAVHHQLIKDSKQIEKQFAAMIPGE